MAEVIAIAAIMLVATACCYGLYRWWSWAGEPEERLDPAARRAVKDAQAAHDQHGQNGGSYGTI